MKSRLWIGIGATVCAASLSGMALANGGPFVVKYPSGDPAAKGVLARIDPSLKPAGEDQLEVVREDLTIRFTPDLMGGVTPQTEPVAEVTAAYRIRNPTSEVIKRDFGFPILRGIYMRPWSMTPKADVRVTVDGTGVMARVISNSGICGVIRGRAREMIEKGIEQDKALKERVAAVHGLGAVGLERGRTDLEKYLVDERKWTGPEAALFVEYVSLMQNPVPAPHSRMLFTMPLMGDQFEPFDAGEADRAVAIVGELKATQWLSILAGKFDPKSATSYEDVFGAWGGDVRERSVDLESGKMRPREFTMSTQKTDIAVWQSTLNNDPTVYARVDYLGSTNGLSEIEIGWWRRVLKELPVVFTFAPMNLLYYQVSFAAGSECTVTVSYRQYPFRDTKGSESYQLAYVVHPASLWKSFGPIRLNVIAPTGVNPKASVALGDPSEETKEEKTVSVAPGGFRLPSMCRRTNLENKTGELLVGFQKAEWGAVMAAAAKKTETAKK